MPDLTIMKSVAVGATRLGLYMYNQTNAADVQMFARILPRPGRFRNLTYEWWDIFPLFRKWIGDRQTFPGYKSKIELTVEPYELTAKLDVREQEIDGDRSLVANISDIGAQFGNALINSRFINAYAPMRANATTTYDNQNLFDTDHVHPDGSTFSNVIDLSSDSISRSSSGAPTADEARRELDYAVHRLTQNRLKNVSVAKVTRMPLAVFVKSIGTWKGYNDLLTLDTIGVDGTANPWKGAFDLFMDYDPVSGDEKKVDVVLAEPGGARPVAIVEARLPGPLQVDDTHLFARKEIYFGTDGDFAYAAALPQPAVRIQE